MAKLTESILIRIEPELKATAETRAEREYMSLARLVRCALRAYLISQDRTLIDTPVSYTTESM